LTFSLYQQSVAQQLLEPAILVIEIRTDLATASLFRQAIGQVIQAGQGRKFPNKSVFPVC
jgi:hypothetical protein